MKIKFDEEKAVRIFEVLEDLYKKRRGIFKGVVLPQDRVVAPKDEREHANFLFYASLPMRGGINSDDPFKWLLLLRDKFPEMFEPEIIVKEFTPEKIANVFREITSVILNGNGTGEKGAGAFSYKMEEHAKNWHENSIILINYWGGDIRNVFWGVTEFEESFRRIDYNRVKAGFKGMRRKIFSLFVEWLHERQLILTFPTPIPIDFHAMRILWGTEMVTIGGLKPFKILEKHPLQIDGKQAIRIGEKFTDTLAKWSQKFIFDNGFSHINIGPALWILSRSLCAEHFQNSSRGDSMSYVDSEKLKNNHGLWPKNYKNPCSHCPISEYCKWVIPSAAYYRWGLLVRLGKRVEYPVNKLPGIIWEEFMPYQSVKKYRK